MSEGWTLVYKTGIMAADQGAYGQLSSSHWHLWHGAGIWRGSTERHLLIATWVLLLGFNVLISQRIKPTHFFLPILLPV